MMFQSLARPLLLISMLIPAFAAEPAPPLKLVVLGSSVAWGHGADKPELSWASRLGYLLETGEPLAPGSEIKWKFANASIPGDNTAKVLKRYDKDLLAAHPDAKIVVIALSLANEGMVHAEHPQQVFDSFKDGLEKIAARVRAQGAQPVFTLAYPQNTYTAEQYGYVKRMNLLLNSGAIPCVNFLGALDDGSGHWAPGYFFDDGHPNSRGYEELFETIVPTLFDAIAMGKTTPPQWKDATGFLHLERDPSANGSAPLSFRPSRAMHSFTESFRIRTRDTGSIAAAGAGESRATLEIRPEALVYIGPGGAVTDTGVKIQDGAWHHIALSHRHATGVTLVYIDGVLRATTQDQIEPDLFALGGPATSERAPAPAAADYQDLAIYRSAWTEDEAMAQHRGELQQASMEICAPLADRELKLGEPIENRAQSMSRLILGTAKFSIGEAAAPEK